MSDLIKPISLAPGFSRVLEVESFENRFNGFLHAVEEAAEAAEFSHRGNTRLKPGVNEKPAGVMKRL